MKMNATNGGKQLTGLAQDAESSNSDLELLMLAHEPGTNNFNSGHVSNDTSVALQSWISEFINQGEVKELL